MGTGDNNTTWGNVTNVNLGTAMEEAIVGTIDVPFTTADVTLTLTNSNATQSARNLRLNLTGTPASAFNLIIPAVAGSASAAFEKPYIINNGTGQTITVKHATGTGIAVPTGKTMWVYANGTNVVDAVTHLTSLTLATVLPIASGGTGGNTASAARTALGTAASGANSDITSLTGLTTALSIAQGGTGGNTAATARTALGTAASGANTDITSLASATTINGDVIGYRGIPRSTTSVTASTVDIGKVIAVTANIAIPNSTFAAGNAVSIYNDSASAITVTASITTLRLAGTTSTGNRTLAARGMATVWFNSPTEAIISGAGVS
jgi:hypothetical protein